MGAETRYVRGSGRTMQEAWDDLVEQDRVENGTDFYGSVLSTVNFPVREVKEFPEELDKYHAVGKCISKPVLNNNKIKTEVENFPCKATRKWVTKYKAESRYGVSPSILCDSQTECITKARAWLEKHPHSIIDIHIIKVLEKMSPKVATISYKKSKDEKDGVWEFMAVVAC